MKKTILLLFLWFCIVLSLVSIVSYFRDYYDLEDLKGMVQNYHLWIVFSYVVLLSIRGLFFIPTMPFILAMAVLVPPLEMFFITLIGSVISATFVVSAVKSLGLGKALSQTKKPAVLRAQRWLNKRGTVAIVGWAFFPFVFTEFIIYLAALANMPARRILPAMAVGEGALIYLIMKTSDWFVIYILA